MKGLQMRASIARTQAGSHCVNDSEFFVVRDRAVAAENPDDRFVLVAFAEELSELSRVGRSENGLPAGPVTAPRWKHSDEKTKFLRLVDDEIHVTEIRFNRPRRVFVDEREISIGIGNFQPAELRQHHGLNHRKTFLCPIRQVLGGFFTIQSMKQFPCRVAEIEKWPSVLVLEIVAIFGYLQALGSSSGNDS